MTRPSGKRRVPGSQAWMVDNYHQSIREHLDQAHESAVMFVFSQWAKRSGQKLACMPPSERNHERRRTARGVGKRLSHLQRQIRGLRARASPYPRVEEATVQASTVD